MSDRMAGIGSLPPGWSPESEQRFQLALMSQPGWRDWYRGFIAKVGQKPNLDPGGDYDYRRAYSYGAVPELDPVSGDYHGLSAITAPPYAEALPLKAGDHPTAWMETFMRVFGVDPRAVPPDQVTPEMVSFIRSIGLVPSTSGGADEWQ